jgi:ribosomal protein S18 acetylase RimI-like enzyme
MSEPDVTIRPATADDADALTGMWEAMTRQHMDYDPERWGWSDDHAAAWRRRFLDTVDSSKAVILAAEVGGEVAGYVLAELTRPAAIWATQFRGEIGDLFVRPEFRRRGIGARLMEAVCDELKRRGAEDVLLRVARQNRAAIRRYESLGLRIVVNEMYKRL